MLLKMSSSRMGRRRMHRRRMHRFGEVALNPGLI
jgi:hypothetical protein